MAEDTDMHQNYTEALQGFLADINPVLKDIDAVLRRSAAAAGIEHNTTESNPKDPEDLFEVVLHLEKLEEKLVEHARLLLVDFNPPVKPVADDSDMSDNHLDKVLLRFLPRLDASLAVIYQTLGQINDADAKLPLETMPSAPEGETLEQRQERFTESLRSVQRSLLQLEPFLSTPLETDDQPEPQIELLYTPPPWSTPPQTPYFFEVREGDQIVDKIPVNVKGHYLIGRLPICDIVADDATCSRQHAIVQFRPGDPDQFTGQRTDEVYIYDLGSTSGTYVNGMPLQAKAYYPLYKGDILQFGQYACAFVLRDCTDPSIEPPPGLLPETNGTAVVDSGSGGGGLKQQDTTKGDSSAPTATTSASATEARGKLDLLSKPLDPKSADFDQSAYKQAMIERYLQQQKENEEILRKRKEREAQGLPVELDLPYVPERPKRKKTKKGKEDCVVC